MDNGFEQVVVLEGALAEGCQKEAPFDLIFCEGSVSVMPHALLNQLAEGGRLIVVMGEGNSAVAIGPQR